ncbi:MAG: 50S ribosomal protein L11 methyltransferase [Peptostreptococcaceae bacterium]|nr:50S ribosomal protein L11 methyltransferase [Peptostreptococcaceae bacterium]
MKYIEIVIYTSVEGIEPVTNMLKGMGIEGIIIENPKDLEEFMDKKNSYDWDYIDDKVMELKDAEPNIKFYLEPTKKGNKQLDTIKIKAMTLKSKEYEGVFGLGVTLGRMYVDNKIVDDEDWKENWKEFFKTVRVTEKIIIKPSWEDYEKEKQDDIIIEIDPGMAFGTGTHATTSLCLKLIEKYLKKGDFVLDVGCGSGILSISSSFLGADKTLGVDIDPIAVAISRENVELNKLADRVEIIEGDLAKGVCFEADIVAANLMADLVMMLTEDVAKHLKAEGIYISSGILLEKQFMVVEKIRSCHFEIIEILEQDGWCAIAARYKG